MATDDQIFGTPLHNDSGKFWHVPADAGKRPQWVDDHLDENSEYYWNLYYERGELEPDELIRILREKGWLTE